MVGFLSSKDQIIQKILAFLVGYLLPDLGEPHIDWKKKIFFSSINVKTNYQHNLWASPYTYGRDYELGLFPTLVSRLPPINPNVTAAHVLRFLYLQIATCRLGH